MISYGFIISNTTFKRRKKKYVGRVLFCFWFILLISNVGMGSLFNKELQEYKCIYVFANLWKDNSKVTLNDENGYIQNINIGIKGLGSPTSISDSSTKWTGSKVYYGVNNEQGILWRVLDKDSDEGVLLFADNTIFYDMYYQHSFINTTWATSIMRAYLNGYIYEGKEFDAGVVIDYTNNNFVDKYFSKDESSAISESYITTKNASNGFPGGENTIDKVFLLSIEEMKNTEYGFSTNSTRAAAEGSSTEGWWWLRSPGTRSRAYAAFVDKDGKINTVGQNVHYGYSGGKGVRPAFKLDRQSILFTNSFDVSKKSYGEFGSYESNVKRSDADEVTLKITLRGTTESLDIYTDDNIVTKGGDMTIKINHKEASILDNADQVSAMLLDKEGNVIYYGKINDDINATDSTVVIPEELEDGNYTLRVFSENINDDNITDYASEFSELNIIVEEGIQVSEIRDIPKEAELGETINLTSTVKPENATFNKVEFRIKDAGKTGAEIKDNKLITDKSGEEGLVEITAYIKNGLLMGRDYEQDFIINIKNPHVVVDDIIEVPEESFAGNHIELSGIVEPDTATFKEIIWSIKEPTDGARIEDGNRFIADKPGMYVLCARVVDGLGVGKDYIKEFVIEVIEETVEIPEEAPPDVPEEELPGEDTPEEELPGEGAPEEELPGEDTPEEELPGEDAPEEELPGEDTPEEELPGEDAPEEELPGEGTPEEELPGEDAPEGDMPKEDISDDNILKEELYDNPIVYKDLEISVHTGDKINISIIINIAKLALVNIIGLCVLKKL